MIDICVLVVFIYILRRLGISVPTHIDLLRYQSNDTKYNPYSPTRTACHV